MENLALGIFCLIGGLFALVAAACNWDWFFAHPKARLFLRLLGRTGARVFYGVLGVLLLILGIVLNVAAWGRAPDHVLIVQTRFPGASADYTAACVAIPLERHLGQDVDTTLIDSESRADGSYLARIHVHSRAKAEEAKIRVGNHVAISMSMMPVEISAAGVSYRPAAEADLDRAHVLVALVNLLDEPDAAFDAWADRVYQRILAEGLVREPQPLRPPEENAPFEVIDRAKCAEAGVEISQAMRSFRQALAKDPQATDAVLLKVKVPAADGKEVAYGDVGTVRREKVPTVVYRVNDHPALRVVGVPPDGTTPAKAATRCVKLAEAEIAKAQAGEKFAVVNLTPR